MFARHLNAGSADLYVSGRHMVVIRAILGENSNWNVQMFIFLSLLIAVINLP